MTNLMNQPLSDAPNGRVPAWRSPRRSTLPEPLWALAPDELRAALAHTLSSTQAAVAELTPDAVDPVEVRALAAALRQVAELYDCAEIADVVHARDDTIDLPAPVAGQPPGERVRALRLAVGFTPLDLSEACGLGESTVREIEAGRKTHRRWTARLVAEALSEATGGQVDASELTGSIVASWQAAGTLAPDGEYDSQRYDRRRRRGAGGAAVRRKVVLRDAHRMATEQLLKRVDDDAGGRQ